MPVLNRVEEAITGKDVPFERERMSEDSRECLSCHTGILSLKIDRDLSEFSHNRHLTDYNQSCQDCHDGHDPAGSSHGAMLPVADSCLKCHHDIIATGTSKCDPCHIPAHQLYNGALADMDPDPSPMAGEDMSCTDCHLEENGYSPPDNDLCFECHDEEVVNDLEELRMELAAALQRFPDKSDPHYQLIKLDTGRAVHHPGLVRKILE